MRIYFYLFTFFFLEQIGYSQTHIYEHFGVDEGLPSSEVYDVYQDKHGYIWFATDKGLSRYNGYEFKNYTTKDGLPDNTILGFYPQKNGQVWMFGYHSQKLFYFNKLFDGFIEYKYNTQLKKHLNSNCNLKSIVIDSKGTLFVGGYYLNGYIEINKEGTTKTHLDSISYKKTEQVFKGVNLGVLSTTNTFFSVNHNYKQTKNIFFVNSKNGTSGRINFVFINKDKTVFIDKKLGVISKDKSIKYYEIEQNPIGIKKIDDHLFFVGYYSNGAEIRNVTGKVVERFLYNKSVSNFLIDSEGSYWFSTLDDGVFYIKNPDVKVFSEQHISSLVKDNDNDLYLGFENGNIGRLRKRTIETLYKGLSTNAALVEFDKTNNILYGYSDTYLKDYPQKHKSIYLGANKLPETISNFSLASSSFRYYKQKKDSIYSNSPDYKIQDICYYNNNLLIGTSAGLFVEKNDQIKKYQPLDILKHRIDDIDFNKNTNKVYMSTQGAGVIVFGDSIYNINKKDGLTNDIVSEVHIENDSTIWVCSNTGLNRIKFKPNNNFNITTVTKADGLLSNDIDDVEIINDTVWVATKKGLCYFKKSFIEEKENSKILSLILNTISANNTVIDKENIKLKYDVNAIDFSLQAISYRNTDKINYLYRLKEIDTSWTSTKSRNISFPSLSPGKYTFEAKASVLNNIDDNIVFYSFQILPPFWKSWWFYGLCGLLITGVVYLFFKIRVLTYNQDVFRELIRLIIKRLKRKEQLYKFRSNGEDFKIPTHDILYINSQGNYLDIVTLKQSYTIRCKIGDFIATTPDVLEYLRVHRSYIIRIDQVSSKGRNWVVIKDNKIPVGETYLSELDKIQF